MRMRRRGVNRRCELSKKCDGTSRRARLCLRLFARRMESIISEVRSGSKKFEWNEGPAGLSVSTELRRAVRAGQTQRFGLQWFEGRREVAVRR